MFTGIIQEVGTITHLRPDADPVVTVASAKVRQKLGIGASVACNGICLTVIELQQEGFQVQISGETLAKTTAKFWQTGTLLNLEPALSMGDALGGHMITGHIDGTAEVVEKKPEGDSMRVRFKTPPELSKFIAPKGTVALDGVSLTVNEVTGYEFGVNIIPHTQAWTTFRTVQAGHKANFEIDVLARYLDRLLAARGM